MHTFGVEVGPIGLRFWDFTLHSKPLGSRAKFFGYYQGDVKAFVQYCCEPYVVLVEGSCKASKSSFVGALMPSGVKSHLVILPP